MTTKPIQLACFIVLACAACGQLEERAWKSHKKPPQIAFDEPTHQVGEIRQGEIVEHSFAFRNLGELDLTIDRTRSMPDCVVTLPGGNTVRKNTAGVVHVALDTAGKAGELRRTITIYTNDPRRRTVVLTLVGRIVADVAVEPAELYVGTVTRGARASKKFSVKTSDGSIRIGAVARQNPFVTLRPVPSPDDPSSTELEVDVLADAPFGPFDQIIRVPTTSPKHPVLRLRVAGIVEPNVTASPERLTFGDTPRGVATVRQLLVRNRGHSPVRLQGAEWDPRLGSVEIDTLREGRRYRVRAVLREDVAAGDIASVVRLATDDPSQPQIEIPVEGRVVDSSS